MNNGDVLIGQKRGCERGFLDSCLKYHDAYLPTCDETPHFHHDLQNESIVQKWNNSVEQMDIVMPSNYWSYYDRNVPQQVIKN